MCVNHAVSYCIYVRWRVKGILSLINFFQNASFRLLVHRRSRVVCLHYSFSTKGKGSLPISSPILYTRRRRTKKMGMETALRMIFLVVFLGWLMVWVLLPTKTYKQAWTPKLNTKLNSTYFGEQGCLLFL